MGNWIQVKGIVKEGHGVASGKAGDPRFTQGTISMQIPYFAELGLKLEQYYSATINLAIFPHRYEIINPKYTFRNVKWSAENPAEDFSFFDCRILMPSKEFTSSGIEGLIYYPHPETKPEHFQSPDVVEILTTYIDNLHYGDELMIEVDSQQMKIYR